MSSPFFGGFFVRAVFLEKIFYTLKNWLATQSLNIFSFQQIDFIKLRLRDS
jgi:hypothetical protein